MFNLEGMARRNLTARPGRTLMTLAALALAVALAVALSVLGAGYAAHQVREATIRGGYFDIQIRHFASEQAPAIRNLAAAIPGVRATTGSQTAPMLEFGPYQLIAAAYDDLELIAAYVNVQQGRLPVAPGEAALEAWAARELGAGIGDLLPAPAAGGRPVRVVGLTEELPGSLPLRRSWAIMSLETLQGLVGHPTGVHQINLVLEAGASVQTVHSALAEKLQGLARVDLNEPLLAAREQAGSLQRILLAVVIFTSAAGVVVTLNTFQISLMERMGDIGVLKSQGISRRQLAAIWLREGLLLGAVGGAAGTAGGLGLAPLLARLAEIRLGVSLPALGAPWGAAGGVPLGLIIALAAAWIPARAAGRVTVLSALQPWRLEQVEAGRRRGGGLAAGGGILLAGLLLTSLLPVLGDEHLLGLLSGMGGLFLSVTGVTVMTPHLLPALIGRRSQPGLLGLVRANLLRHRSRTAVTMSTLLLGVTLLSFFSGVLHGQRARAEQMLRAQVPTDFVVETPTFSGPQGRPGGLEPERAATVAGLPEVAAMTTVKLAHSLLAGNSPGVPGSPPAGPNGARTVLVGIDPDVYPDLAGLALDEDLRQALRRGDIVVTGRLAAEQNLAAGGSVTVQRGGQLLIFRIAGVVGHEPESGMGAILIDRGRLSESEGNGLVHRLLINLRPGAEAAAFTAQVRSLVAGARGEVISFAAERERLRREAAEMLAYVSAMVGLVGLLGLSGIFNTFLAAVRERTREIGVLKSLGLGPGRIGWILCCEAAIMGLVAAVLGMILGGMTALVVAYGMSGQWSAAYLPAPAVLAALPVAAVGLSMIASAWPARLAGRLDPAHLMRV